jgi:hypothetical protein
VAAAQAALLPQVVVQAAATVCYPLVHRRALLYRYRFINGLCGTVCTIDVPQFYTREQMLLAGVSVGVASTFGTPVGAVLFSIEVTSIYYMLSAYAKCMLAAVAGRLLHRTDIRLISRLSDMVTSTCINVRLV